MKLSPPVFVASALLAMTLGACGESARGKNLGSPSSEAVAQRLGGSCGSDAAEVSASAAGHVANQIYAHELSRPGVQADQSQVEDYVPLLSALEGGDRAAVRAAVTRLVFSHTHIVRLRITRGRSVLADVGGPYVLAPVGGDLRLHGRLIGRYLLSVQDDLGFVKLEARYIGAPIVLYSHSRRLPLQGTLASKVDAIPAFGATSYRHASYDSFSFPATAFPTGTLRIDLLVPPTRSAASGTCAAVRASELGRIARRIWRRFSLAAAPPAAYVRTIGDLTGALAFVRSRSGDVAASEHPGPPRLPDAGAVSYRGATYAVSSFATRAAGRSVRVFLLVSASGPRQTHGTSG
jgi:hypothetical protein